MATKIDYMAAIALASPIIVFIVLAILRLAGAITWSWWWVTSPLWIAFGIILLSALLYALALFIAVKNAERTGLDIDDFYYHRDQDTSGRIPTSNNR